MADEETRKLLTDWDLAEYIPNFASNKVTYKVLPFLDEPMLKELIPIIGDRALFNINCKNHYQKETDNCLPANSSIAKKKKTLRASASNINCDEVQKVTDSNDLGESDSDDADLCENSSVILEHFESIKEILRRSDRGKNIILNYNKKKSLSPKDRTFIVDVLTTDLYKLTKRANNSILELISKNIINEFPSETLSVYYIPPIKRKNSGSLKRSIPARGKIVNKWRNLVTSFKPPKNTDTDNVTSSQDNEQESFTDPEIESSIQWLKENANAPLKDVALNHWKRTASLRIKEFINCEDKNITNLYQKWPILNQTSGFQLIISDFNYLQKTKIDINNNNWNEFFQSIKGVCNERKKDEQTKFLENLLNEENLSDDSRASIQLLLLPHYIPSKAISKIRSDDQSKKGLKTWKITIGDAKDSIIQIAKVEGDTEVIKEKRIKFSQDHKQTLQPYIIIVAEELKSIDHAYVCVDKTLYTVNSIIQAIDVCFKIFHVFNLAYPIESKHIWLIIQKCLYKFKTQYDEILSYTEHLIMELEKNTEAVSSVSENLSDNSSDA